MQLLVDFKFSVYLKNVIQRKSANIDKLLY